MQVQQRRVMYVEDSENWLEMVGEHLTTGLQSSNTLVETSPNFDLVRRDLRNGNLPQILITDNDIEGENTRGAQIALQLRRASEELRQPIVLITLLCSNPEGVQRIYGEQLTANRIQNLDKREDAGMLGFYCGDILNNLPQLERDRSIPNYGDWLNKNEISYSQESTRTRIDLNNNLITSTKPGCLYLPPKDFILNNWDELTRFNDPEFANSLRRMVGVHSGHPEKR
ncbi:hypothetical protein HGA88_01870 [Candidatus Roizmanbacteria bacterium]|nr:hypothetical protein [Candidatus Roizmanbacteria bacterium]